MRTPTLILTTALLVLLPCFALAQKKPIPAETVLQANAEQKKEYADTLMALYTNICIKNIDNMNVLRTQLEKETPLPPDIASYFLKDLPGKVWPVRGMEGAYMLALADNAYYCAVHTLVADVAEMEKLFDQITATAPKDAVYTLLKNEQVKTERNGIAHTKIYALTRAENPLVIMLTLTTYTAPQKGVPQGVVVIHLEQT